MSRLGIGTWQLGGPNYVGDKPTGWGAVNEKEAVRAIQQALDEGVRFIDTADSYGAGQAETLVGQALAGHHQSASLAVEICTKFGNRRDASGQPTQDYSPTYLTEAVDASLRRLQRDTLDILLLHSPPDAFDWSVYDPAPFEALIRAGKIKSYGVSSRSVYGARRVMEAGFGSVLEVIYNALDRRAETVLWDDPAATAYRFIARVPLASGFLKATYLEQDPVFPTDQYRHYLPDRDRQWLLDSARQLAFLNELEGGISAAAVRFCLSHPAISVVIPGVRSEEQVSSHSRAVRLGPLPNEITERIKVAVPDVPSHWKPA
ncbi:aldo/keto reductase [Fibrella sp. HMF5405]|uniref:Aldo/keto reductase n=1 Tax=Fibrella forsythiae TaxID=2817061 RepID=A0ABS3JQ21_9BACT|nr:aldo/keto reductase [Fibrella forsythiae]